MKRLLFWAAVPALLFNSSARAQAPDEEAIPETFLYSAKFLCSSVEPTLLPGDSCRGQRCFDTEVSIHNVNDAPARVVLSVVDVRPIDVEPLIARTSRGIEIALDPNDAVRIDCAAIDGLLPTDRFIGRKKRPIPNGFLRIESDVDVEAIVAYAFDAPAKTEGGEVHSFQLDVQRLEPRIREGGLPPSPE